MPKVNQEMIEKVCKAIRKAFLRLKEEDGSLFECPIEVEALYDSRKLHEVCREKRAGVRSTLFPLDRAA